MNPDIWHLERDLGCCCLNHLRDRARGESKEDGGLDLNRIPDQEEQAVPAQLLNIQKSKGSKQHHYQKEGGTAGIVFAHLFHRIACPCELCMCHLWQLMNALFIDATDGQKM